MPPTTRASVPRAPPKKAEQAKKADSAPAKSTGRASVSVATGKASSVKTARSAVKGAVSKAPARSTRAPTAAAATPASVGNSPKPAVSIAKMNPQRRKPARRSNDAASPAASALAACTSITAPAPQRTHASRSKAAKSRVETNQPFDEAVDLSASDGSSAGSSPHSLHIPHIDLLADEDRFCVRRICAIMRDVCLDNAHRRWQLQPRPQSHAAGRCVLIAVGALLPVSATVAKRRKTEDCQSYMLKRQHNARVSRFLSYQTLLISTASRIHRCFHLGLTKELVLGFAHFGPTVASSGSLSRHSLALLILSRVFGERLRETIVQEVRMDVGRMLLDQPLCSFVSDLQREAKSRFVPDVAHTPCLGGEISQDALNVEALHGNRTRCELAVISNPQMLENRFNSSDVRLSGCTALHLALMKGHESTARLLLSYRADVNATYGQDRFNQFGVWFGLSAQLLCGLDPVTPLLRAAENGQQSVARLLLEFRADLHARNCCGKTALMVAASQGHASIINLLLAQCTDVNERTFGTEDDGHTALMIAASEGHAAIVRLLLQQRADANAASNSGQTALMESAAQGNLSILQLLIEHGAEIDAANKDGRSAFVWAALGGHDSVMRHLIRHKACISPDTLNAKLDCDGNSLLLWATSRGQESTVRLLLEQHADVNATDAEGRSAILEAADKGHEAIFRLLLEYGADVNVADVNVTDDDGSTLLMSAICNGDHSLARLLLEHGANVNSMDKNNCSSLYLAVNETRGLHCQSAICLLLEHKADINARNNGETVLMKAATQGNVPIMQLLIERKADVEGRNSNYRNTPLMCAAYHCQISAMSLLIQNQADVNARNQFGDNALMWACETKIRRYNQSNYDFEMARRKHDTVLLLLQSKADPNTKSSSGLTALGHCSLAHSYRNDRWEKHLQRILQASAFKSPIDFSDPRLAFDWGPGSLSDEDV